MKFTRKKLHYDDQLIQSIERYQNDFYRLAYSYTKNEQDALDVVQDSIQKAMQSYEKLIEKEKIKSWFYKIVVHTSLDFLRKHKRVQVMEDEQLQANQRNFHDAYENVDLEHALDDLPTIYREVVILRFFEDLKIEDIAFILEENTNTIKTRLYKALRLLRADLKTEEEF